METIFLWESISLDPAQLGLAAASQGAGGSHFSQDFKILNLQTVSRVKLNPVMDMWSQLPPEAPTYLNVATAAFWSFLASCEMSMTFKEQHVIAPSCHKGSLTEVKERDCLSSRGERHCDL